MSLAVTFRGKVKYMKSWKPKHSPSNRDRLELFALHKQAVSGDAPPNDPKDASVGEKAKLSAWRNKRGMSQGESMQRYVEECDRQIRLYGNRDADESESASSSSSSANKKDGSAAATAKSRGAPSRNAPNGSASNTPMYGGGASTPQNTPSGVGEEGDSSNVLLCPRGLAAIPLLCAAASESRPAYLARLQATHSDNGWWGKQEPLCLEVDNPLSLPERCIIGFASQVEKISLLTGETIGEGHAVPISPRALQAFLWPVHNIFLAIWILWILTCTYCGSVVMMSQTLLFGSKRTKAPLNRLFLEEINPASHAVESLCEQHQAITVRVAGLALMPMMMLCNLGNSTVENAGILIGSIVFVALGFISWWYWFCVLPWLAGVGVLTALTTGWCFSLIELSGN